MPQFSPFLLLQTQAEDLLDATVELSGCPNDKEVKALAMKKIEIIITNIKENVNDFDREIKYLKQTYANDI